jgi:hypothetical protein
MCSTARIHVSLPLTMRDDVLTVLAKLNLKVHYPEGYPDVLPDLSLEPVEGEFNEEELASLITDMHASVRRLSCQRVIDLCLRRS